MRFQRLFSFAAASLAVSALVGSCSIDGNSDGGLSLPGDAGLGGFGPHSNLGGSGGMGGSTGADAAEPAESIARDDLFEVSALEVSTLPAPGLLANDTLIGDAVLVKEVVSTRLGGSVEIAEDGSFVYTPPADPGALPRLDNFTYRLEAEGVEFPATVSLGLVAPPLASDDDFGTLPNQTLFLSAPGVLENDEPNGARVSAFDEVSSEGGVVSLTLLGELTYAPPSDFAGEDSFTYTLSNITGTATATVRITVDEAPSAAEDHYIGSKGQVFSATPSLLANDALGAPLASIVSFGGGSLGGSVADHAAGTTATAAGSQVSVSADGSLTLTPDSAFVGPFELFYRLESSAGSADGRVVIDVHQAPLATDDDFDVLAGEVLEVSVSAEDALLANDVGTPAPVISHFGGGSLGGTVADHSAGSQVTFAGGQLTVRANGSLAFAASPSASGEYSFDYQIESAAGQDEGTVRINVDHAPEITSPERLTLQAGTDLNLPFELTATGSPEPVISVSGVLPDGVVLDDGSLTGSADIDSAGEYDVLVTASNGVEPAAEQSLTIIVQTDALLTGSPTATFTVGTAGSYEPLVLGVPTPVLTLDGELPDGLTFDDGTGAVSGTPAAGAGGVYEIAITADNGIGADSILLVTLEVLEAPALTSAASATFVVGEQGSFSFTTTGHPARTVAVSGTLPGGVAYTAGNARLSGTPAPGSGGSYELDVSATNGVSPAAGQSFTLTVNEAPSLSGAPSTTFRVGQADSYTLTSSGFPAPTLGLSGSLPSGVTFDAQTGTLSGTPGAGTSGSYPLSFSASNGIGAPASLSVTLNVDEGPAITSANAATFTVGTGGSFTVTATGTPAPTLSLVAGTLPAGVTFTPGTGELAGTPDPGTGGTYPLTFGASNGVGSDGSQSFTLTVLQAPALLGASTTTFTVGSAGSYVAAATGFPAPALSLSGTLPDGVSFQPLTGTLSGTPEAGTGGSYALTIGASNGVGIDASLSLTLTVEESAEITSDEEISFLVGEADSFTVTATGEPAPTLALDETLPSGLTFTPATGVLEGTPAAGTGGEYTLTFSADNGIGTLAVQTATLTIEEAPGLSGAPSTTFVVGAASSYSVARTGFPLPTLSLTGTLPAGLTFAAATGSISGTPQAGTAGSYSVTIGASNGIGSAASLPVTIQVDEAPGITSGNSATFTVGSADSFTVTASGTPAPSFGVSGTLPTGVTLNTTSGVLSGTPASGTGGTYPVTLSASNGVGSAASQSFTLTVNEAPGISGAATTTFVVGSANTYTPSATGFPAPSFSLTGSLPSGLSFSTSTGVISGTAASGTGGSYPLTISASNGIGSDASLPVTLTVDQASAITSASSTTFTVGTPDSFTVTASGTPAPSFGVSGTLPTGVTLNTTSGVLSGTPASGTGGTYPVTLSANNGVGSAASQSFTLTVNEAPGISGAATTTFVVGSANTYTPSATGFPAPSFSLTGSLPSGLSFSTSTGVISGTAASGTGGSYPLTISASNGIGSSADLAVTLTVTQAPAITSANSATFTVGSAGSFTVTASGDPAPTFGVTGTLPSGVTLNTSTGVLSGTPASGTGGTYSLTLSANNGVGSAASQTFTLTVNQAPGISGAATTTFVVGTANTYTPSATGFPAPSFSLTGSLPSGLSFSTSTGVISGTAASGTGGSYPLTISASNGIGSSADLSVTLTVTQAPALTSANSTTFTVGSAGSFTVTASGDPSPTFGVTGTLPSGVTLNASTGVLSGTPAGGTGGTYPITLSANNGVGSAASQSFTLTVNEAPSISGTPPSPVDSGTAYSHTFTAGGFPAPTFSVTAGTLPTGLTLNASTGVLSGTPTVAGTFSNITVAATNIAGSADITFSITVNNPVPPPSATGESFTVTGNIPIDVTSSVLSNDTLNTATITGFGPSLVSAATTTPGNTLTTNAGGSVVLATDGTFVYDPPAGTTGTDSFAYTVTNAGGSSAALVSFTISNRVWFVDSTAAGGGSGKLTSPFTDLPSVTSTTSGDVIYALRSVTPYSAKTLSSGQRLLGQGVTINATHLGFTLAPFSRSTAFGTAGANSALRRLVLATNSYVRGFDATALSGVEALSGSSITGVDLSGMAVTASNAVAVNLQSLSGAVSLRSVTATGGSFPIFLLGTTGSFTVTGDGTGAQNGSGGTISGSTSSGITLQTTQNVTLRSMNLQNITTQAIFGTNVVNLTMDGMQFSTIGTALDFDENLSGNNNISGTVSITNSSFSNATAKFLAVLNFSGTLTSFIFENNTLNTNPSGAFEMLIFDTARAESVSIKNNTFTNTANSVSNSAIQVYAGRTTLATSTPFASVRVENNTITGSNGSGIRLRVQDSNGTLHARVLNNSVTGVTSSGFTQGIRVEGGTSTGDSTVCAQISGNTSVFTMGGLDPSSTPNAGIGVRRQTGTGGTNDVFGIVGLAAGSTVCPVTGTSTCAGTPAVETFVGAQNPAATGNAANGNRGGYLISSTTGFSSCTLP